MNGHKPQKVPVRATIALKMRVGMLRTSAVVVARFLASLQGCEAAPRALR